MAIPIMTKQEYFALCPNHRELGGLIASMTPSAPKPILRQDISPTKNPKLIRHGFIHSGHLLRFTYPCNWLPMGIEEEEPEIALNESKSRNGISSEGQGAFLNLIE